MSLLGTMTRDVDEVTGVVPRRDRIDGSLVRLGSEDVLGPVALGDERGELLRPQLPDVPRHLLGVGQREAEAAPSEQREQLPVVMQCRIDVDRDAHS